MDLPNNNSTWHPLRKVLFRFFTVFFALEIFFNTDFITLWLGAEKPIILLGQNTMVVPLLWLNTHIFQFNYNPYGIWLVSPSLILVKDITYVSLALLVCLAWTLIDRKRANYNKLDFWLRQTLWICLSGIMWSYGISKVFPVQMPMTSFVDLHEPIGDMHPFTLLWTTLGYGTPYQIFTGMGEASGAILLLFKRTRVVGLVILLTILCNVVMLNYTYAIGALTTSLACLLLLITIYLLSPYLKNLWIFSSTDQPVNQSTGLYQYLFTTRWKKNAITAVGILILGITYVINFNIAYSQYTMRLAVARSRKYAEVKNFVVNNDTLNNLILDDTVRWRFWNERISSNNELGVTVHTMNSQASKTYLLTRDSINHTLTLKPYGKENAKPIALTYNDLGYSKWHVEGTIEGKYIAADLQNVDPDTTLNLLRVRRQVFEIDPEKY